MAFHFFPYTSESFTEQYIRHSYLHEQSTIL